jgi:hypothetical protein
MQTGIRRIRHDVVPQRSRQRESGLAGPGNLDTANVSVINRGDDRQTCHSLRALVAVQEN